MDNIKLKYKRAGFDDELSFINRCPECNSNLVIYDSCRGENICNGCGLVLDHHILDTERTGKRAFTTEEKAKRERTGAPISILLPDMGLSTVIDSKAKMSQGMKRAIKWNSRLSWNKRNLLIATTEIKRIGSNLNLPLRVKELAAKIYRKAFKNQLLRGRSIKAMVAASIYYSCRKQKIPRTLQEIVDQTNCIARDIRRSYRILIREFNLKVPSLDPVILIPKYSAELGFSLNVEKTAVKILNIIKKRTSISGKDPKGLVAAAIYLSCQKHNEGKSQSKIARTIGITEVTLRSRYKEFQKYLKY
ncbi:MAG: transcription initiation factor IIB [Promethearchaeota archaeon]